MKTGDKISTLNANWSFSGDVPKNFDNHVSKSVPLYVEGHDLICRLSDFFISDKSKCYEIGSSTGELTKKIALHNNHKEIKVTGIEPIHEMVEVASQKCKENSNISFLTEDILNVELEKSDLIVSYYTIQFIKPRVRQLVFNKIYESLNWGGAFILFEKVRACDARFQDIMTALYTDYKLEQGYNEKEILSKTRSLKGVLEPFSTQGNLDLLKRAGFVDITSVMKYVSFEGFLAIK
ncbi:Type 12 methyltransferase [Croceitalea dokdonensis DOKDO 023]|uniref:Type 12 methyltransferase n=1 Tax=Croceitalea dokdonensis DOKDO 023 TaxID=1300341 RepID=A0A0P7A9A5_9FLAO|nr:methyltransferase domain-containing protein [Croceitalea dokdonensis]KPM33417.1 Type 12 methyltransferase [Croceitalea dokdonensis DOKDO 023]